MPSPSPFQPKMTKYILECFLKLFQAREVHKQRPRKTRRRSGWRCLWWWRHYPWCGRGRTVWSWTPAWGGNTQLKVKMQLTTSIDLPFLFMGVGKWDGIGNVRSAVMGVQIQTIKCRLKCLFWFMFIWIEQVLTVWREFSTYRPVNAEPLESTNQTT